MRFDSLLSDIFTRWRHLGPINLIDIHGGFQSALSFVPIAARRSKQMAILLGRPDEAFKLRKALSAARARSHAGMNSRGEIKYIGDYLSLGLTRRERLRSIVHHYEFLKESAKNIRIDRGITLWRSMDDEGRTHALILQPSSMAPMEGETELCFRLDGERLFTLTFSIVDGGMMGCDEPAVVFVGGIQGAYFGRHRVRYAARKNHEIAPITMLLLAVNAVATVFGIRTIAGTSNQVQIASLKSVDGRSSSFDYDDLWARNGGVENKQGHYLTNVVDSVDVRKEVSGTHRARTRRRREKRIEISAVMVGNAVRLLGSVALGHHDDPLVYGDGAVDRDHRAEYPSAGKIVSSDSM